MKAFRIFFTKVHLPKVIAAFKSREIIKVLSIFGKYGTAQVGRVGSKTDDAVFDTVEFYDNILCSVLIFIRFTRVLFSVFVFIRFFIFIRLLVFILIFLFSFLLFFLKFFEQFKIFFAQAIAVVSILIQEYQHDILL